MYVHPSYLVRNPYQPPVFQRFDPPINRNLPQYNNSHAFAEYFATLSSLTQICFVSIGIIFVIFLGVIM